MTFLIQRLPALVVLLSLFCNFIRADVQPAESPDKREPRTRHLIICVDGVGFSTIEKMRAEGRFQAFGKATRLIAPFPTLTNVSMTEILGPAGAGDAAGYEDRFYDDDDNRMRGGLLDRFNNRRFVKGTFRELFDYHPSAIKSGLGYALPPLSTYLEAMTDLVRLRQKFRASDDAVFFGYLGSTDSLSHLGGERMVRSLLAMLDESIKDIVRDSGGRVKVTLFSDHGNHYRKYKRVSLKSALRRGGFRLESKIKDQRSVVLPQFGLIGCALLFTRPENEAALARLTSQIRGVDFAVYEQDGAVRVIARSGEAVIERRGDRLRYRIDKGDPLGLRTVLETLVADGKADDDGYIADSDWFNATLDGERPDVVRRVYDGAHKYVRNRANVIVSFEDGYYSGSYMLDIFAFLQATHGNVMREQSSGFAMTTARDLPGYLRAGDMWSVIGSPSLRNAGHVAVH
jgi:mRNA-degrading endonuclease RelE of RelBE toxin-antitoxin system